MRHVELFPYAPGRCAICTSGGPGVDFDRDLGQITADLSLGALYLCDGCIEEAAALGPESRNAKLRAELKEAQARIVEAEQERDAEVAAREALAASFELVERTLGHQSDAPEGAAEPAPPPKSRRAAKPKTEKVGA